ncbi:MAG: hypothetical protein IJ323_02925 [Clostridia bacterium]|nr:hypothetical protein [Clostridia bacterium]
MKKRLISIIFALLMLCQLLSFSILAEPAYDSDNETPGIGWVNTYDITLTEGTGYTLAAVEGFDLTVNEGASFSFTVTIADGYEKDETAFAVKANDVALTATDNVYTIENVTADQVVTVEGVKEAATTVKGDFSGDGKVNARDVAMLRRAILNGTVDALGGVTDFSGDNKTNARDVAMLRRAILQGTVGDL